MEAPQIRTAPPVRTRRRKSPLIPALLIGGGVAMAGIILIAVLATRSGGGAATGTLRRLVDPISENMPIAIESASCNGNELEVSITNIGSEAIRWISCDVTNEQPGRTTPFGTAKFYCEISGGIEPGETKIVRQFVRPWEADLFLRNGIDEGHRIVLRSLSIGTTSRSYNDDSFGFVVRYDEGL